MNHEIVKGSLARIMHLLLKADYAEVEQLTLGQRYPEIELRRAMESHYEKLAMPPEEEFAKLFITTICPTSSNIHACAVTIDFWVEGNGRSDLSLECTFIQIADQPWCPISITEYDEVDRPIRQALHPDMQKALQNAGMADKRGNVVGGY